MPERDSILFIPHFFGGCSCSIWIFRLGGDPKWALEQPEGSGIKNASSDSMSWFECAWFNDNHLECFNQPWLHFSTEFHLGIDHTTGLVWPLLSHGSVCFLGLIFFLCCSIKINLMAFFISLKTIWSGSFEESSLCPSFSVQLLHFLKKKKKISLVLPQTELGFLPFPAIFIPYIYIPWSQKSSSVLISLMQCLQPIIIYILYIKFTYY